MYIRMHCCSVLLSRDGLFLSRGKESAQQVILTSVWGMDFVHCCRIHKAVESMGRAQSAEPTPSPQRKMPMHSPKCFSFLLMQGQKCGKLQLFLCVPPHFPASPPLLNSVFCHRVFGPTSILLKNQEQKAQKTWVKTGTEDKKKRG